MALYNLDSSMKRNRGGSHSAISQQPLLLLGLPLSYRVHLPWIRVVCQHQELQRGPEYAIGVKAGLAEQGASSQPVGSMAAHSLFQVRFSDPL